MDYCKIGFLCGNGGNLTGIGDYFQALDRAGRPAIGVAYDNYGVVQELLNLRRASEVPHICAFRPTVYPENPNYDLDPIEAANALYGRWFAALPSELLDVPFARENVWLIWGNEGRKESQWGNWWGTVAVAFAQRALADGLRTLAFGWSAGTPEPDVWQTTGMSTYLKMCHDNPNRLGLAVHEGANPSAPNAPYAPLINNVPWISGRYRFAFDRCDELGINYPRVLVSECAWKYDDVPEWDYALGSTTHAAHFYAQDPQVMGICLWWLGHGHGGIADKLQPFIAKIQRFALSDNFDGTPIWIDGAPPPPKEPPMDSIGQQLYTSLEANFSLLTKEAIRRGFTPTVREMRQSASDGTMYVSLLAGNKDGLVALYMPVPTDGQWNPDNIEVFDPKA